MRRAVVGAGALALALAACSGQPDRSARPSPSPPSTGSPTGSPPAADCPATYAAPDPRRPRVSLRFRLDGTQVTGQESLAFTPDLAVRELVFRLWPENPNSRRAGARLVVTSAAVEGRSVAATVSARDRTLLSVPLGRLVAPGTTVHAVLGFRLTLPPAGRDRYGAGGGAAWWGTGAPLLAWERGVGWATEQATRVFGESQTSEAAVTDVAVDVPAGPTVLMTGRQSAPITRPGGRRLWRAHAEAARDVSVAVASFALRRGVLAGGAPVTVGVAAGLALDPRRLLDGTVGAVARYVEEFGPYPYESLTVAAVPGLERSGVEYPAAIQVGTEPFPFTLPHEVAHEWFYGLVGNDQARDAWLDEGFATYAQSMLAVQTRQGAADALAHRPEAVDQPTDVWDGRIEDYFPVVYLKAAGALLAARTAAGEQRFDRAIRCYVAANAWRIARPADLARALTGLPPALEVLRRAGALPAR